MLAERPLDVAQRAAHPVEADAGQAHLGLGRPGVGADEDDRLARTGDVAGVFGEAAVEADVDRTPQVPRGERLRGSGVDQQRTLPGAAGDTVDFELDGSLGVVEQLAGSAGWCRR